MQRKVLKWKYCFLILFLLNWKRVLQSSALHKAARDIMRNSLNAWEFFAFFFKAYPPESGIPLKKKHLFFVYSATSFGQTMAKPAAARTLKKTKKRSAKKSSGRTKKQEYINAPLCFALLLFCIPPLEKRLSFFLFFSFEKFNNQTITDLWKRKSHLKSRSS